MIDTGPPPRGLRDTWEVCPVCCGAGFVTVAVPAVGHPAEGRGQRLGTVGGVMREVARGCLACHGTGTVAA